MNQYGLPESGKRGVIRAGSGHHGRAWAIMASTRKQHGIGGFTLVELLIVIGIITVLISLLLPALNKARAASEAVQCASNMRQIGVGLVAYANEDHQGYLPYGGIAYTSGGTSYYMSWDTLINQYIGGQGAASLVSLNKAVPPPVLWCPTNVAIGFDRGGSLQHRSYAMVEAESGVDIAGMAGKVTWVGGAPSADGLGWVGGSLPISPAAGYTFRSIKLNEATDSANTLLLVEQWGDNVSGQTTNCVVDAPTNMVPEYTGTHGAPTANSVYGYYNWLFCDGHVEKLIVTDTCSKLTAPGLKDWTRAVGD